MQTKNKLTLPFSWLLLLLISTQAIAALPEESIILDPNTGDYTITYWDYPDDPERQIRQAIFVPNTKIDPLVKSSFKLKEEGEIVYMYQITNGLKSRQALISMLFDPVTNIISASVAAIKTPDGWLARSTTSRVGGLRIGWSHGSLRTDTDGLPIGKTQEGFGFSSKDIPGIGVAQFRGNAPVPMFPAEGPQGELAKRFDPIEQNNFVTRIVAIPSIAVPAPFDAATLLERIQTHTHTWIGMKLIDPEFSAQLDTSFKSAIDGYHYNQPKMGKSHIKTMRVLLKKAYPDLDNEDIVDEETGNNKGAQFKNGMIARLAARVLDFDLKYVLKQVGDE